MTTIFPIKLTCPCCGENFESQELTSTNQVGQKTDFQPVSMGIAPFTVSIHRCMNCGFSGFDEDFDDPEKIPESLAVKIMEELGPHLHEGPAGAGISYEFAARIAELKSEDAETVANLYLMAAWCCAEAENPGKEKSYRLSAIEHFKRELDGNGSLPDSSQLITIYLIGELFRRVGESSMAHEWFGRVISEDISDEEGQALQKLALRQKENPADMM